MRLRLLLALIAIIVCITAGIGCSGKPAPDTEMVSAPTGLWIGEQDAGLSVDIQAGGFIKFTRNGQETVGEWESAGENAMKVTLNGQTYDVSFTRQDLNLQLTLPGETSPTSFTQM